MTFVPIASGPITARTAKGPNTTVDEAALVPFVPIEFGWQENQLAGQYRDDGTTGTAVRRLTPLECERLMGWPDHWTAKGINGPIADSHRYRMCGNGVVAPITKRIGQQLP